MAEQADATDLKSVILTGVWVQVPPGVPNAGMAESADAADSKSAARKSMRVQVPLPAPYLTEKSLT